MTQKKYYRPDEVASRFNVSISHIYNLIRQGKLHAIRIGASVRIHADVVDDIERSGTIAILSPESEK